MIGNNTVKKARKTWRKLLRIFQKKENSDVIFFTYEMVNEYAEFHRVLQATIAIVSNYRAGVDIKSKDFNPRGIYKAEGGVQVDDKDIVIKRWDGKINCYNDWDDKEKETPSMVQGVIEEILRIRPGGEGGIVDVLVTYAIKNTNMPKEMVLEKISRFTTNPYVGKMKRIMKQDLA